MPNLIVCPQDEIIKRTLIIYALSPSETLPSDQEILYCNSSTIFEEIELFWKRVSISENSDCEKIYLLINMQDLLYDQAVKAKVCFEKLLAKHLDLVSDETKGPFRKFCLCTVCSSERENKSVFVTSFNRFRKNVSIDKSINEELNKYLMAKFSRGTTRSQNQLLDVEKDNLTARLIMSDRAGVGKSNYIKLPND